MLRTLAEALDALKPKAVLEAEARGRSGVALEASGQIPIPRMATALL
jgi:hypothetical protein